MEVSVKEDHQEEVLYIFNDEMAFNADYVLDYRVNYEACSNPNFLTPLTNICEEK